MFKTLNINNLDLKIQEFVDEKFTDYLQDRRSKVLRGPKHNPNNDYHYEFIVKGSKHWKLKELRLISIMSWYISPEIRYHLNLFLDEIWTKQLETYSEEQALSLKLEKELMLSSKQNCLGYILLQDEFNEFDFFGNILNLDNIKSFDSFKIICIIVGDFKPSDKQYSGWCRGPKDKGSTSTKIDPNKYVKNTSILRKRLENELKFEQLLADFLDKIDKLVC